MQDLLYHHSITKRKNAVEDGQGFIEYALILLIVSIASIILLIILGGQVGGIYEDIACTVNSQRDCSCTAGETISFTVKCVGTPPTTLYLSATSSCGATLVIDADIDPDGAGPQAERNVSLLREGNSFSMTPIDDAALCSGFINGTAVITGTVYHEDGETYPFNSN